MQRAVFAVGLLLFGSLLYGFGWIAWAADKPSADEAAIRGTIDSYVAAYNKGDAKAVAAHWGETSAWINPAGQRVVGRAAIEKQLAAMFTENKGLKVEVTDVSIRLVTADVAIEEGTATTKQEGASSSESTYIAVHVKHGGKWQLDSVRETEIPSEAAEDEEGLDQLGWLVGEWVDSAADSTLENNVAWTKNGAFLTSSFRVVTSDVDDLEGTQVIGFDPVSKSIRSWMFDSDGGFGQGTWKHQGDRWIVNFSQTLADGQQAVATNIYTFVDEDSYTWQSIGRSVDGEALPNIEEVKVVRAATASLKPASSPKPDGSKSETSKSEISKPDSRKPDASKPDNSKPGTSKPASSKPNTAKPAATKAPVKERKNDQQQ